MKKALKAGMTVLVILLSLSLLLAGCDNPSKPDVSGETSGNNSIETSSDPLNSSETDSSLPSGEDSDTDPDVSSDDGVSDSSSENSNSGNNSNSNSGNNNNNSNSSSNNNNNNNNSNNNSNKVVQASFTRNEDGTCTDRKTGVIFLDDDLDNWKKTYERGTELQFDSGQPDFFNGDSSRVLKNTATAADSWFTYKLDSGITEVGIVTFVTSVNGKVPDGFDVMVSKDNKTWTTLSAKKDADVDLGSNWYIRTYRYTGIDKANKFLKIQFKKSVSKDDPVYNPNISRLRINNIDKMNDPDRFLEDRASATFYVDSANGSDKNEGTSPEKAFKSLSKVSSKYYQPGDRILFKSGCSFNGSVTIKGYGEANARVTVGSYGSGSKPKISARGGTAVTVQCDYVTVENLEVTNPNGIRGISIAPAHTGAVKGVVVQNNYVHDVQTSGTNFIYSCGGITVGTGGSAPTWYDGMLIQNNTVKNTARTGIFCSTSWADRYGFGWGQSADLYKNDNDGWYPYESLKISGNTVDSPQGDGILVIGGRNTVIERNVVYNAFSAKQTFQNQTACAGLWTINTNNTVVQYNEVAYTRLPISQNGADGEGYDIDCAENGTVLQYNYSHNNEGGFLLMCDVEDGYKNVSKNHVVRFNLSVNDATRKNGQGVFMITNTRAKTDIYNNTIVAANDGRNLVFTFGGKVMNMTFTNNILYGNAKIKASGDGFENCKFENNLLAGGAAAPSASGITVSNNKTGDPKFKNASATDYKNRDKMIDAFTPTASISGASAIPNNGGKDITGASIGSSAFYGAVKY